MVRSVTIAFVAAAAIAGAAPAFAQAEAAPAAEASAKTGYTSEQVRSYLKAAIKVNAINTDAAVAAADKPAKMMEAVKAEGLEPETFNAIAQASQTDAALQAQLQTEMASIQQPTQQN